MTAVTSFTEPSDIVTTTPTGTFTCSIGTTIFPAADKSIKVMDRRRTFVSRTGGQVRQTFDRDYRSDDSVITPWQMIEPTKYVR